jgi:hypothetical protein
MLGAIHPAYSRPVPHTTPPLDDQEYGIKSPTTGNDLTFPFAFNLMFKVSYKTPVYTRRAALSPSSCVTCMRLPPLLTVRIPSTYRPASAPRVRPWASSAPRPRR